ncbi:hypothetical protein [Rhodovarius lipocyclicus]|jgi:hypothetical protein|uniref:hypothetical protein n=1 Tax=Rhodovarius lipocyclicus TaxID=268410 RepID=UPI001357F898|nr:hypothetical protein [Rhodovarius lipocyclicus]
MADPSSLGGVPESEIAATAAALGVPSEAGSSLLTRFIRGVVSLVTKRHTSGESGQFAVFLQSDAVSEHAKKCRHVEVPMLSNGADPVSNRVFLSSPTLKSSFRLCLNWTDAASLFGAIREVGLGDVPAFVVDFRGNVPVAHMYRRGLDDPESAEDIPLAGLPITTDQMKSALDRFYEASLRTPFLITEAHGQRVWKDAGAGTPESRPEERIQGRLVDLLRGAFPHHDLRGEPRTPDGRADIVVSRKTISIDSLPAVVTEWVLELKALADMTTNGTPSNANHPEAVRSALEQALAYQAQLNGVKAAVCCYDMRGDDEGDAVCFAHIAADAATNQVPLWRWYLFRDTAESRAARGYLTPAPT